MAMSDEFERVLVECAPGTSRSTDEGDIIELADGRLLVVWSDYESGGFPESPTCLLAMTSDDMGQTWSGPCRFEENAAQESLMCLSLLRAASGSLLLFYGRRKSNSDFQVFVRRSPDEGRSWGEPVMVTAGDGYCVMINARVIQLSSGRLVAPVERTEDCGRPDHVLISTAFFSDDDGETWTKSATDISLPKRGALEPGVVELADGRLLMIIRTELGHIYRSCSGDEGMTWSSAEPLSIPAARSTNAAISRIPDTDGLLLVCRGCFGQDALVAAVSSDAGATWSVRRSLEDTAGHAYAYPSVNFAGDRLLLTYWVRELEVTPQRLYMKFRSVPVRELYAEE